MFEGLELKFYSFVSIAAKRIEEDIVFDEDGF
jgi:hypothetical protein